MQPWRRVRREDLSRQARTFLRRIGAGDSVEKAAARAGVSTGTARSWLRDAEFADAYATARARKGRAQVINPYELLNPDQAADLVRDRIAGAGIKTDRLGIRK